MQFGPAPMSRRKVARARERRGMTVPGYGTGAARRKQRSERLRIGLTRLSLKTISNSVDFSAASAI